MPTFILAVKQYLHLHLLWSHTIICFCNEAVLALSFFFIKLPQHFICIEATSTLHSYRSCANIHFCHEATTTLHLYRSRANVQYFIRTETMKLRQQFIFARWQHSTLALALALKLHQYLHRATSKLHLHRSHDNIHLCHEATTTLHLYWSRANIHKATSKLHLHRSHANIHEATSILYLHQSRADIHLCHEVMTTLHLY